MFIGKQSYDWSVVNRCLRRQPLRSYSGATINIDAPTLDARTQTTHRLPGKKTWTNVYPVVLKTFIFQTCVNDYVYMYVGENKNEKKKRNHVFFC